MRSAPLLCLSQYSSRLTKGIPPSLRVQESREPVLVHCMEQTFPAHHAFSRPSQCYGNVVIATLKRFYRGINLSSCSLFLGDDNASSGGRF